MFVRGERLIIMTIDDSATPVEDDDGHSDLFESEGDEHGPDEDDDGS
jgi:hypothetical protein